MAFPASQQTVKAALDSILSSANRIKSQVSTLRNDSAAGPTARMSYIALLRQIGLTITLWDTQAAVPGLAQYARDQFDNQTFNIATEYAAMRAAAVAVRDWIFAAIPTDAGSGAALLETYDVNGNPSNINVSVGQSNGFRTVADAFIATIG